MERRRLRVTGTVQGVGFRPFVYRLATELGLSGEVANDSLGVLVEAEGPPAALDDLARRLAAEAPPLAHVAAVETEALPPTRAGGPFRIVDSRAAGAPAVAVPVDSATCADCARELADPADRRHRYPFVNCTNCGPRYTIIRSIPYDRAATTMATFAMCADCRREYEDPADRRFHAEPNACPRCGPHLSYRTATARQGPVAEREEALARAVADLRDGRILAVKGLGGYHLACDAARDEVVGELRRRKARDDKPFAIMVDSLEAARRLCLLDPAAEAELASPRRPIVLAPRRPGAPVAAGVAPGLSELGLLLPYTPLHLLLLGGFGGPLVMTSGNLSDEPIAHEDADALDRLGPLVDGLLTHDRGIHIRCDDSVVRARDRVQMVRRSRGYAPEPVRLVRPACRHVLAVGAELKSTVAVAKGRTVVASHHIGDLEHLAAYRSFLQAVSHLCDLTGVTPQVVAHDLHPEYLSTKFAAELDLPAVAVQHHWAHIASNLAEHGRDPDAPVLGVAFDGLGLGPDGTIWGGEFLVADLRGFRRVGHLLPVPLVGGNLAMKEPWRMALVWADAALGRGPAERFGAATDDRWPSVLALTERPDVLLTSSAGRLFDAVAALLGIRARISYEGQAAIELEALAHGVEPARAPAYRSATGRTTDAVLLDPRPLVEGVVADRDAGRPVAEIAAGFHDSLGRATAELAAELAAAEGLDTVALSGGVFQNARLTTAVAEGLARAGLHVLVHRHVPPNDGGISIGQAAVAALVGDGDGRPGHTS